MKETTEINNNIIETGFNLYFLYVQSFINGSEQGEDIADVEDSDNVLKDNLVG